MEKIILIIRTLDAIVEMIEILYPENGAGKEKLQKALELFGDLFEEGKAYLEARKDAIVSVIGKLVAIKNLWKWKKG